MTPDLKWQYRIWNPAAGGGTGALEVDTSRAPLAQEAVLAHLAQAQKLALEASNLTRFQATRPLAEDMTGSHVAFLLDVGLRGRATPLHKILTTLVDCECLSLIAASLQPGSAAYERVQSANKLYVFCFDLMVWSLQNNVAFTIENPANSWMWSVFAWLARKHKHSPYHAMKHSLLEVVFDACQHGGTRPKAKLLTNCKLFAALRARCDNNHPHEPWGAQWTETGWTFATHLEAAYPLLLADRMADLFAKHALAQGARLQPVKHDWRATVLALQGRQDRKSPVLIPEFRCIKTLKASQIPTSGVRILTAPMMGVHTGRSKQTLNELNYNVNKVLNDNRNEWDKSDLYGRELEVGFYRTPKEWFDQARHLSHPMDVGNPIAAITREALRVNVHEDAKVIELKRKTAILKVQIEAKKLQESELDLRSKMPAYMQKVLKNKNILLFESLLRSHGYDDLGVVDFLKRGVDLTGASECPDCFERRVRLASLTRAELVGAAPAMRKSLMLPLECSSPSSKLLFLRPQTRSWS